MCGQVPAPGYFVAAQHHGTLGRAPVQPNDVVSVEADVVEVVKEAARDAISVRFTGMIREEMDAVPQAFDEVWHLT